MKSQNETACRCPYCETPVSREARFCAPCQVKLVDCAVCGKPVAESARKCPHCAAERKPREKP
jgi:hypothetical protein